MSHLSSLPRLLLHADMRHDIADVCERATGCMAGQPEVYMSDTSGSTKLLIQHKVHHFRQEVYTPSQPCTTRAQGEEG